MSTTVCQSNVPTLQRKVAVPHAQSMATERRKRGTRTPRPKHDTRVAELVDQVKRLMERNGVSGLQLSHLSGIDQSHISKWLRGEAGFSIENVLNVLTALNAGWSISLGEEGDVRKVPSAGTVRAFGVVVPFGGIPTMPALFDVSDSLGPFRPGDRILIEPGVFTPDRWALVSHPDGVHRLVRCEERGGLQLLVGAETVLFDEGRHRILGLVESRIERV